MRNQLPSPFILSGLFLLCLVVSSKPSLAEIVQADSKTTPTWSDVRYGKYARNILDVYLPADLESTDRDRKNAVPVFIFLHGGGWMAGDKKAVNVQGLLRQGFAVVSANYRFTVGSPNAAPYPAPMLDAARVVQYVRHRAADWNLDAKRIALAGSSAGAVMAMWVGYQDDLSKPDSEDPVARQSTRVACVLPSDTPTTFDRDWILKHVGGPKKIHLATYPLFRIQNLDELAIEPKLSQVIEATPITHLTPDDPPTYLSYQLPMTETPLPETVDSNISIHHPRFGAYLCEELEERGVPCFMAYKGHPAKISKAEFLKRYLLGAGT
ncbi:MAG: alpha/beta hydrolase [Planctomycetota bacterium]